MFDWLYSEIGIHGIWALEISCFGIHCTAIFSNLLKIKFSDVSIVYEVQRLRYKRIIVTKRFRVLIPKYDHSNAPISTPNRPLCPIQQRARMLWWSRHDRVYPAGRGKVFIPVLYGETLARLGGWSCYQKRRPASIGANLLFLMLPICQVLQGGKRWLAHGSSGRLGTLLPGRSFLYGLQFDKIYYCWPSQDLPIKLFIFILSWY